MLCDVDPALEKQRPANEFKAGKTFSQRITHTHTHTGPKAYRFIHHHDKTLRSDQSQSVLHQCDSRRSCREGTPCPPAAQAVNATRHNTLTCPCHSINQALGGKRKHSSSEQTRTRKHLRRDQDIIAAVVTGLCTACADHCVEQHQQYHINLQFAVQIKTGHCSWCQLQQLVLAVWMPKAQRQQYF